MCNLANYHFGENIYKIINDIFDNKIPHIKLIETDEVHKLHKDIFGIYEIQIDPHHYNFEYHLIQELLHIKQMEEKYCTIQTLSNTNKNIHEIVCLINNLCLDYDVYLRMKKYDISFINKHEKYLHYKKYIKDHKYDTEFINNKKNMLMIEIAYVLLMDRKVLGFKLMNSTSKIINDFIPSFRKFISIFDRYNSCDRHNYFTLANSVINYLNIDQYCYCV